MNSWYMYTTYLNSLFCTLLFLLAPFNSFFASHLQNIYFHFLFNSFSIPFPPFLPFPSISYSPIYLKKIFLFPVYLSSIFHAPSLFLSPYIICSHKRNHMTFKLVCLAYFTDIYGILLCHKEK